MKCIGTFKDDRICDVCKLADEDTYWKCFKIFTQMKELNNKLTEIENKCPHRQRRYDDWQKYYVCNFDNINSDKPCMVTLGCEIKEQNARN